VGREGEQKVAVVGAVEATPVMLASMLRLLPEGACFNVTVTGAAPLPLTRSS
jgi:hypothetical protein